MLLKVNALNIAKVDALKSLTLIIAATSKLTLLTLTSNCQQYSYIWDFLHKKYIFLLKSLLHDVFMDIRKILCQNLATMPPPPSFFEV